MYKVPFHFPLRERMEARHGGHSYSLRTLQAEDGELGVLGQSGLHRETQANLGEGGPGWGRRKGKKEEEGRETDS